MTLPVSCPSSSSSDPNSTTPRKRRRRAPAGGAADDCFACVKRNSKCDRRRPYCSQCLEVGKECSGYRTHLTWGIGVASRGKLRGLSLPVARSAPAPRSPSRSIRTRSASNMSPGEIFVDGIKLKNEPSSMPVTPMHQPIHGISAYDNHGMAVDHTTDSFLVPDGHMDYSPSYRAEQPNAHLQHQHLHQAPHQPQPQPASHSRMTLRQDSSQQQNWLNQHRPSPLLQQYPAYSNDRYQGMPSTSFGSAHSFPGSDYTNSPTSQSFRDDIPYQQSSLPMYDSYSSNSSSMHHSPAPSMMIERRAATSHHDPYDAPSDVSSSIQSQGFYDIGQSRSSLPGHGGMFYDDDSLMGRKSSGIDLRLPMRQRSWSSIDNDDADSLAAPDVAGSPRLGEEDALDSLMLHPRPEDYLSYICLIGA